MFYWIFTYCLLLNNFLVYFSLIKINLNKTMGNCIDAEQDNYEFKPIHEVKQEVSRKRGVISLLFNLLLLLIYFTPRLNMNTMRKSTTTRRKTMTILKIKSK